MKPNLQNLAGLAKAIPIFYRQSTIANNGELFFEIQLVVANGEQFEVEAILDTGFKSVIRSCKTKAEEFIHHSSAFML